VLVPGEPDAVPGEPDAVPGALAVLGSPSTAPQDPQ